jgi:hypothetical protein
MVVQTNTGISKTTDRGVTWARIFALPPNGSFGFETTHHGAIAWDPTNNILYGNTNCGPVFKAQLSSTRIRAAKSSPMQMAGVSIDNSLIHSSVPFDNIALFSLSGMLLYKMNLRLSNSVHIPMNVAPTGTPLLVRIATSNGIVSTFTIITNTK